MSKVPVKPLFKDFDGGISTDKRTLLVGALKDQQKAIKNLLRALDNERIASSKADKKVAARKRSGGTAVASTTLTQQTKALEQGIGTTRAPGKLLRGIEHHQKDVNLFKMQVDRLTAAVKKL